MRTNLDKRFVFAAAFSAAIALGLSVGAVATFAATAEEISWDDLLAPAVMELEQESMALREEFQALNQEEQTIYRSVSEALGLRERIEAKDIQRQDLSAERRELLDSNLWDKHPEAMAFWDKVKALNEGMEEANASVDPALDGKSIRMPGYVLPVQIDDGMVYEFMLVPYVGACVHTPPPPPNQLVYVKSTEGFASDSMYAPVWVEGVMSTTSGSYDLSYRDGDRDVEAGYLIDAEKIETYEEEK